MDSRCTVTDTCLFTGTSSQTPVQVVLQMLDSHTDLENMGEQRYNESIA